MAHHYRIAVIFALINLVIYTSNNFPNPVFVEGKGRSGFLEVFTNDDCYDVTLISCSH